MKSNNETFYTFPDGKLGYDCQRCHSACCRGKGIGFDGQEFRAVLIQHPALAYFSTYRGDVAHAMNPPSACWFLQPDGLCTLHVRHGWELKPATCRLFPFNRIFTYKGTTIVDFNSVICPLCGAEDNQGIRHGELADEINRIRDVALTSSPVDTNGPQDAVQVLGLERDILTASDDDSLFPTRDGGKSAGRPGAGDSKKASYRSFAAYQSARGALGSGAGRAELDTQVRREEKQLEALCSAVAGVVGQCSYEVDEWTVQTARLLTSSLRFNELFRANGSYRYDDLVGSLPRMLLLWTYFVDQGAALHERRLDLRDATQIWNHLRPVLYGLAHLNERPVLPEGHVEFCGPEALRQAGLAFARACFKNKGPRQKTLRALLAPHLGRAVVDRIALLHVLAPVWEHMLFG